MTSRTDTEAEARGKLVIFQLAIGGRRELPEAVAHPARLWATRWDELSEAMLVLWCELLGKPGWARFRWDDLVPEMKDFVTAKTAAMARRACKVIEADPTQALNLEDEVAA